MGAIAKYREEEEMALPSSLVRKVNLCELDNAEGVEGQSNPHQCPLEVVLYVLEFMLTCAIMMTHTNKRITQACHGFRTRRENGFNLYVMWVTHNDCGPFKYYGTH